jgi:hypothetical protein
MGIKFKCPQGHKIHVKAFLAGKRAICPHCGAKVTVPLASTNDLAGAVAAAASMPVASAEPFDDVTPMVSMEEIAAPAPGGFATLGPSAPQYQPAAAVPKAPAPAASAPTPVAADPIAEAPLAVWYVRPRAGGQFGPAPGEMFRRWLAEGRVGADALVWREGWPDWKVAVSVFSSLAVGAVQAAPAAPFAAPRMPPSLPTAAATPSIAPTMSAGNINPSTSGLTGGDGFDLPPLGPRPGGTSESAGYPVATRRGSKSATLIVIALLAVVAVSLLGVLIFVISR